MGKAFNLLYVPREQPKINRLSQKEIDGLRYDESHANDKINRLS